MAEKIRPIIFYIIFFMFLLAFGTTATNYDYDLWARLIVGMYVLKNHHLAKTDFLSYSPTHEWFDHEWGGGVIFYLTQKILPIAGFLILQTILLFATYYFIIKIIKLRGVKTTHAYNFWFYYFSIAAMNHILNGPIRCQMFSFLFFTIFLYVLERARTQIGKNKELLSLPIIMIFWCNIHGGCSAGIGLIILYIVGEFFNKKTIKKYIYALITTSMALLINPWGFEYIKLLAIDSAIPRVIISEWVGLFSKYTVYKYINCKIFGIILILAEIIFIIGQIKAKIFKFDKTKFLVLITTLFLAIQHLKLVPFAIITMTCFLYDDFYTVFNSLTKNLFNKIANAKDILTYLIVVIFALSSIKLNGFGPYLDWSRYPVEAVEFIKINKLKGNLLQDFTFGSYISYKLYPQNKIFMDGRFSGVYDYKLLYLLGYFHTGEKNWDYLLKVFPTDIILIQKTQPTFKILVKDKYWQIVHEDKQFAVFVKRKETRTKYIKPSNDINHYKKTLFDTDVNFMLQSKNEH